MLETLETIFYAVLAVGTLVYYARDRLSSDETAIEKARRLYAEGTGDSRAHDYLSNASASRSRMNSRRYFRRSASER